MSKPARNHHYIPKFYLAGFTASGRKDDKLWVLDQKDVRLFNATPKAVAAINDYNRVDIPGIEPDSVEKALGKVEGMAARVIRKIIETEKLPTGKDYSILMNFIALIDCRVPTRRHMINKTIKDISNAMMEIVCATPERFKDYTNRIRAQGVELPDVSYSQMVSYLKRGEYTVEADQMFHIGNMFRAIDTILPYLAARQWVLVVNDTCWPFVCSDHPFSLVWTTEVPAFYSPGHALMNTEATIPLCKNLMLAGRFQFISTTVKVKKIKDIASLNSRTGMH